MSTTQNRRSMQDIDKILKMQQYKKYSEWVIFIPLVRVI